MKLANKGENDCDILVMSATPIPRTLVLTFYGDMDVSRLIEKPADRKEIITLSKPENKIKEVLEKFFGLTISITRRIIKY